MKGTILRIEKISPNDGRGLRTVVFFKGCPLRCRWCSTPESQKKEQELFYKSQKCTLCGRCVKVCPKKALSKDEKNGKIRINEEKCDHCLLCVKACPSKARGYYGDVMTVEQVMKTILKDEIFYFHSGGGVTLSGGDVLCQAEFAEELLKACKEAEIHTMAELDMFGDYGRISRLLPYLDELFADIKLMDGSLHKKWTGADNRTILQNIKKAAENCGPGTIHIRVPLVWGINDTKKNIEKTAEYCSELKSCRELEFLPYHRLGQAVYGCLQREYLLENLPPMSFEDAYEKVAFLKERKLPFPVKISGKHI